ncbi:MAG: hypothetical protein NZ522_08995, partial [Chitinophagales bacterium]|nr:hypothetical protein [Chitinophagales bacterium]
MSDLCSKNVLLFVSLCLQYLCPLWVRGNEQVVLIWNQAIKKIETPEGVLPRPYFEGAYHYKDDQYLPSYIYSISGSDYIVSAELQDVFYITADSAEQLLLKEIVSFSDFPVTITQGNAGGIHQAVIKVIPFRINGDKRIIEKLVSFKIKLSHSPFKHYKSEASRGAHSYSDNSVLAAGEWIKVAVERSSMYKLTYSFIKKHFSIEPANLSFSQFGVFGNYSGMLNEVAGAEPKADDLKETPLFIQDNNNNGKFDADDYVLFYGESPHTWQYIEGSQSFMHQKHIYSDKNFYFITINKGSGKTAGTEVNNNIPNKVINTFDDFAFYEEDERNLLESGRLWLGNRMSAAKTSVEINFSFPNILLNQPIRLVSAVAARTPQTTANNATQLSCNLGSSVVLTHILKGSGSVQYGTVATYDIKEVTPFPSSDNIKLIYNYSSMDNTGEAYIDYIEINCKRRLTFTGSSMNFR